MTQGPFEQGCTDRNNQPIECTHAHVHAWDFSLTGRKDFGMPVVAPAAAIITEVTPETRPGVGFGNTIRMFFTSGTLAGSYGRVGHLTKMFVKEGQRVTASQILGLCGDSGRSEGPHIHYQTEDKNRQTLSTEFEGLGYLSSNDKHYYDSKNTFVIMEAFTRNGNAASVGQPKDDPDWFSPIHYNSDREPDFATTKQVKQNTYAQYFSGGTFGEAVIVYDALNGARNAVLVRTGFYKNGISGWLDLGGPSSFLLMPLADEYSVFNGSRQDFQNGYLTANRSSGEVQTHGWPSGTAPGETRTGWNAETSYAFVDAYRRNGSAVKMGNPINTVHDWDGQVQIQDFRDGSFGESAIIYCASECIVRERTSTDFPGSPHQSANEAFVVRGAFWQEYKKLGPTKVGFPREDEWTWVPGEAHQAFQNGRMHWTGTSVEWIERSPNLKLEVKKASGSIRKVEQIQEPKTYFGTLIDDTEAHFCVGDNFDLTVTGAVPNRAVSMIMTLNGASAVFPLGISGSNGVLSLSGRIDAVNIGFYTEHVVVGERESNPVNFSVTNCALSVSNTAPFGYLDAPAAGNTVKGAAVPVYGWALDREDSSLSFQLLVDNQVLPSSPSLSARSDVCQVFPTVSHCAISQPGFTFTWNTVPLRDGSHAIAVRVTDPQGLNTMFGPITVTISNQVQGSAAHFAMSAQNKTANDGGTLSLSVPVNGNVTVGFDGSSTIVANGATITSWIWKSNGTQICSNSSSCSFNFGTASNTITLTVVDSNGKSSTATGTVALSFQQVQGLTAHFSMSAQGKSATDGGTLSLSVPVNGNVTVSFDGTPTTNASGVTIASWAWKSNGAPMCSNASSCSFNFGTASNTITLTVTDNDGQSSTATGTVMVTVDSSTPKGFTTSADTSPRTIAQGQSTSLVLTVQSQGGFNQQVDVFGIGLPSGSTASWTQEHVTPPANGTVTTTLTINATSSTTPGSYPVILRATSAGYPTKELTLPITVTAQSSTSTPLIGSCAVNGQPNPVSLQVGQQATFLANVTGGTGTIHFAWSGISGNDSSAASQIYLVPGTYDVSVVVSDSGTPQQKKTLICPQVTVTVNSSTPKGFTTSADTSPRTIKQGESTSLTLTVLSQGGFNQQVDVFGIGLPTGSTASWTQEHVTPPANGTITTTLTINANSSTTPGNYPVILRAASAGYPTRELTVTVTVTVDSPTATPLTGSCVVNGATTPVSLEVGQQATFNVNVSGGIAPYSFVWSGIIAGNTQSAVQVLNNPGTYDVSVIVTDSGTPKQEKTLTCPRLTVGQGPSFSLSGLTTNVQVQAGSTSGPFQLAMAHTNMPSGTSATMSVTGLPVGVTVASVSKTISGSGTVYLSSNVTATASAQPGIYYPTASVTAALVTRTIGLTLTVTSPPPTPLTGSCLVNGGSSPITLQVGNQVSFEANISGGTGARNFVWTGITAGNTQSAVQILNGPGIYNVSVVVSDSGTPQQQRTLTCPQVTVASPPPVSASCVLNPDPIVLGNSTTLTAGAIGGKPPYNFLLPGGTAFGPANTATVTPTSTGSATYQVTAKDSNGQTNTGSCSVTVNVNTPYVTGFNYSPNPAKRGQTININIYGENFISGTTQVWFVGPNCSGNGCQTFALSFAGTAYVGVQAVLNNTGTYAVNIRNGNSGTFVNAGTVSVVP